KPVLDLVAGTRAFDEGEPVAAGLVVLLRDDFDDIAGPELGAQGNHAPIYLGADTCVADLGVNGVSEVDWGAVSGDHNDFSLGRKGIDLLWIEIHLQAGEEFVGVGHLLLPLDELTDPVESFFIPRGNFAIAGLVLPVGSNSFLSDAMHLFG